MLIATKGSKIDISSEKKTEELAKKINSKIKAGDIPLLALSNIISDAKIKLKYNLI